tara:strand:- start:2560 stop:2802 length:243 start_codon:yes stop_codon:yes gene_type:complete
MAEESTQSQEATITVDDVSYPISTLTDSTRELLQLYSEAETAMLAARRQAAISELAVKSLSSMISASVKEGEVTNAEAGS